jgi:sugar lactone lactonase YvrE
MYRLTPKFALRLSAFSACAAAIVGLSGCAGISGTALSSSNSNSVTVQMPKVSVHGGQQPIGFAHVYLYAATDSTTPPVFGGATCPTVTPDYGAAACSILPASPQTTIDGNGNYYLTTGGDGFFNYSGLSLTCPSAESQVYILATNGNATGYVPTANPTTQNAAIALSAALGSCTNITPTTFTSVNEVTTAAMAFALGQFMTSPTNVGAPVANATGLKNAFVTANNLVDTTTGDARTSVPNTVGTVGTVSTASLNLVANILAACVNSGGPTSPSCSTLFTDTNTSPTAETLTAAINIVKNPSLNASDLAGLAPAVAPFQPTIDVHTQIVTDLGISVTYKQTVAALAGAGNNLVIDRNNNVWVVNCQSCLPTSGAGAGQPTQPATPIDSIVEYSPTGSVLNTVTGIGIHNTQGMAIDSTGTFLYTANQPVGVRPDEITRINMATGVADAVPFTDGTFANVSGLAFDNAGTLWATSAGNATVDQITTGATLAVINSYQGGDPTYPSIASLTLPLGVATDNAGSVWVMATNSNINSGVQITPPALVQFVPGTGPVNYFTSTITSLNQPLDVSIDNSNNIWTFEGKSTTNAVTKINSSGTEVNTYGNIGINQAAITAIDGAGNVLIPSCATYPRCSGVTTNLSNVDQLVRLSNDGSIVTLAKSPAFNGAVGIGIDAGGNAWVSSYVDGSVTEVLGYAAPTLNPLATASSTAFLGKRPQ